MNNKKIEDLLNLPPLESDDTIDESEPVEATAATDEESTVVVVETAASSPQGRLTELDDIANKIDSALPTISDLAASDQELDYLAKLAVTNFEELMALGLNSDPRFAADIFSTASTLLGHAISAKNAKIDKKLKIVQLQLQKARLDLQRKKMSDEGEDPSKEAKTMSRSELLAMLANKKSDK